jgi:hypothetical protein
MDPQSTVPVEPLSADEESRLRAQLDPETDGPFGNIDLAEIRRLLATLDAARASQPVTATALREAAARLVNTSDDLARWDEAHGYVVNSERDELSGRVAEAWGDLREALAALPVREDSQPITATASEDIHRRLGHIVVNWRDCGECPCYVLAALPVREDGPTGIDTEPRHLREARR